MDEPTYGGDDDVREGDPEAGAPTILALGTPRELVVVWALFQEFVRSPLPNVSPQSAEQPVFLSRSHGV